MTSVLIWLAAIAAVVVLYSARYPMLRKIGLFLVVDDGQPTYDAIVILNGNISTRTYTGVDLYKRHRAPVLIARLADTEEVRLGVIPNISDATRELLRRRGVAADDIMVLASDRWIAGTWAEAMLLCDRIRSEGYRRVTIVTDAFHTRRARWAFRRVMGNDGVAFTCAATPYSLALADQWWRSEYGFVQVVAEYIKFLHYRQLARRHGSGRVPSLQDLPPAAPVRQQVIGESPDARSQNG